MTWTRRTLLTLGLLWGGPALAGDVLWYHGNGGTELATTANLSAALIDAGADGLDQTDVWPSDLSAYHLVFLSAMTAALETHQQEAVYAYLSTGGVLVVVTDENNDTIDDNGVANGLMASLDAALRHDGVTHSIPDTCAVSATTATHPATEGLQFIAHTAPGGITYDANDNRAITELLSLSSGATALAVERNIVLAADVGIFSDACEWSDNAVLIANLVRGFCAVEDLDADDDGFTSIVCGGNDCEDADATINRIADEVCDGRDNDCDGQIDLEPVDGVLSYPDIDQDGFGATNARVNACAVPAGYILDGTDCDDTSAANHPGADEYCDDQDNNCNGYIDESDQILDGREWYRDADGDGYGDPRLQHAVYECALPLGYAAQMGDCDDQQSFVNPDSPEYCNSIDDNCDGAIDEDPIDASQW
ncbi:MAG: putative metal-binding motif-containing protein, partial [Myxococcota bacterium]